MRFQTALSVLAMLAAAVEATPLPKGKDNGAAAKGNGTATATVGNAAAKGNGTAGAGAKSALVLPDGRIKKDAKPEDFNVLASVFKSGVVRGTGLNFSDIVVFPDVAPSLFDKDTKPFEITISDKSIFTPQGGEPQSAIRRADLLPSIRSTLNDSATTGVRTMHFSIQTDKARALNTQHDYQLFNLESKDFSFHQLDLRTGAENAGKLVLKGNNKAAEIPTLFTTDFVDGTFNNFAIKMDFDKNTVQVFHSTGNDPLTSATEALPNDMAGNGEFHFALQKNPIGTDTQETGINEGIIFGGIFMEDSSDGTVTLQ